MGQGYVAEITTNGEHFRLYSERKPPGYVVKIYDVNTDQEVLFETADSLDRGKERAEECIKARLDKCPPIVWKYYQAE